MRSSDFRLVLVLYTVYIGVFFLVSAGAFQSAVVEHVLARRHWSFQIPQEWPPAGNPGGHVDPFVLRANLGIRRAGVVVREQFKKETYLLHIAAVVGGASDVIQEEVARAFFHILYAANGPVSRIGEEVGGVVVFGPPEGRGKPPVFAVTTDVVA